MEFTDSRHRILPNVISPLQANKDLANGEEAYMLQTVIKLTERKSVRRIPVVEEFSEVFANYFPGLPPIQETEFRIKLEPMAASMHKVPYRITPLELKELKI